MKRICSTPDLAEAELLRGLLRLAEIESTLSGRDRGAYSILSGMPVGIDVSDEDAERAEAILKPYYDKAEPEEEVGAEEPEPLSPEESAAFEAKVRGRDPLRGWRLLVLCLVPVVIWHVCYQIIRAERLAVPMDGGCHFPGRGPIFPWWELPNAAAGASAAYILLVAAFRAVHTRKEKGPASV